MKRQKLLDIARKRARKLIKEISQIDQVAINDYVQPI